MSSLQKKQLLSRPIEHIDMTAFDASSIIEGMGDMSFTARSLGRAADIVAKMLADKDCTIFLSLAGSSSAGGCMRIYSDLVKYNMVDAVIATGASIVDMDFFEALGFRHYRGRADVDDRQLRELGIDRIYDSFIDEAELQACDRVICEIAGGLEAKAYSSRGFIREMGRFLKEGGAKKEESLVGLAYEHGVPIFCPAFTDSSAGFGLVKHQVENPEGHISIDSIADFRELTEVKIAAKSSGLLIMGGGVPKNFVQDSVVCAPFLGKEVDMHKYAVQVSVADVRDGGCSGSTLREACSWGKVDTAHEQMVFAEISSVLPLLASHAYHSGLWKKRGRRCYQELFDD